MLGNIINDALTNLKDEDIENIGLESILILANSNMLLSEIIKPNMSDDKYDREIHQEMLEKFWFNSSICDLDSYKATLKDSIYFLREKKQIQEAEYLIDLGRTFYGK